ncbi:hypothetical protein [Enterococcus plantarum]|uniref:hypothetical protein n=1 Tax=Enterococcus TaxID=1350 RepID=UPI001A8E5B59|nr:hypothetical protein [Enterococcus plantarum]MBO0423674.1 hypothetical protein [Enterococcus plantarum]
MYNVANFLEKVEKKSSKRISADDVLNKDIFTYRELISLINSFVVNLKSEQFIECQISSETEIDTGSKEALLDAHVDTEWSIPDIEINENLVWYPQKNETTIELDELSESLIAIYSSQSDYCLTIVSKEVFYDRKVLDVVQSLLTDISFGDINLVDSGKLIGEKKLREIVDHLIKLDYVFVVRKKLVKDMEEIIMENTVDWEIIENYSIEFTKKGREDYLSNVLGLEVMRFMSLT